MSAPLTQVKQTWAKVGETILSGVKEMLDNLTPLMVAHYTLPDLKGKYVYRHKGRTRRQHALPRHRQMWQRMAVEQRKARECNRGTSNVEVGVG